FDALRLTGGRYMAERYTVVTAPSTAVVAALWRRGRGASDETPRILAFGDPTFANERSGNGAAADDARRFRDAFAERGGLVRLTGSGVEARSVAGFAPEGAGLVRLRDEASEAFLKQSELDDFSIIHFATHALVDEASLARTALALAPGGGEDGFVAPGDLAALHLDADLVVLSACRTAGGVVLAGEGVRGLATPLLEAGARTVVATQWRVPDQSTVRLIDDFYAGLARGLPAGDALRGAKLAAMERGAPAGEWAAFTLVGDPLVRVALRQPSDAGAWGKWAAGASIVAGVLLVGLDLVRRRKAATAAT
ncbi:MAG TPA: CHAT domain-containing protein, partial [Anaeromyxobacteraceae bacterium]|nr:CHAT domain-containing protein [Anaeromyxobacteraceae bacterium]